MNHDFGDLPLIQSGSGRFFKPIEPRVTNVRTAVISIPKAGTYLTGLVLKRLGLVDAEIHAGPDGFDDYRGRTLEEKRQDYLKFGVTAPMEAFLPFVGPGQFVVGHFPASEREQAALSGFKRIFCIRDIRDAIVSHMRFMAATGRGGSQGWRDMAAGPDKMLHYFYGLGEPVAAMYTAMTGWHDDPNTFRLPFETLLGDQGDAAADQLVSELARFLNIKAPDDRARARQSAIGAETLTYSGKRSTIDAYWNEEVEARFEALGLASLNDTLGYPSR